jgi:hypothetical protein
MAAPQEGGLGRDSPATKSRRARARVRRNDALSLAAACRKSDPVRLSRLLRGELDWSVLTAVAKERGRRYETASGLARDIEQAADRLFPLVYDEFGIRADGGVCACWFRSTRAAYPQRGVMDGAVVALPPDW